MDKTVENQHPTAQYRVTKDRETCNHPQGVRKIGPEEHKRENKLVILCKFRLAIRLLYFCTLSFRVQYNSSDTHLPTYDLPFS